MMKKYLIFLLCIITFGCTHTTNENKTTSILKVATTIYPLTYFTQQIGGQYVNTTQLVQDEADIHNYKLTVNALNNAQKSDLVLYIDPTLEPYTLDLTSIIDEQHIPSINMLAEVKKQTAPEIGQGQTLISGTLTVEESSGQSPTFPKHKDGRSEQTLSKAYNHLWLHPSYAIIMCEVIKNELTAFRPEYEAIFQANYNQLKEKLLTLNQAFESLSDAPNKYFITTHDAFSTWQSYGLIQIPILDYYENELPQQELQQLINASLTLNLYYLFQEPNIHSSVIEQIQNSLNLESIPLYTLATLTEEQIQNGDDYFTIMYENINHLKRELY